jgi:hypothetical protein
MYEDRGRAYVKMNWQRMPLGRWGSPEAREAYDRLIAEWLAAGRKLPTPTAEDEPATVTDVLVAYKRHADGRYGPDKAATIKPVFRITRRLYGSETADTFGPKRLRVVRDRMMSPMVRSVLAGLGLWFGRLPLPVVASLRFTSLMESRGENRGLSSDLPVPMNMSSVR